MMDPAETPPGVDASVPSPARVYDYALGGEQHFAVDRAVLEDIAEIFPASRQPVRDNRDFLLRAVRFCVDRGVSRFLDLGSGIPTVDNVHEVARRGDPTARVVYVDNDPVAAAHARRLIEGVPGVAILQQDLRESERVLADPKVQGLIADGEPIAVLMVAMAHYLKDADDPVAILSAYREAMPSGSFLVFSHMTGDDFPDEMAEAVRIFNRDATEDGTMVLRSHAQQRELLEAGGFSPIEPGLTHPASWRPDAPLPADHDPRRAAFYAAVAHPR